MELSIRLMNQIISLFFIGACGAVLTRMGIIRRDECELISKLSVYLLSPCLLLSSFLINIKAGSFRLMAFAFGMSALLHGIYILVTLALQKKYKFSGVDAASMIMSNAGNIVIPLVIGTIGREYVIYSAPYLVVQNLFTWTLGVRIIGEQKHFNVRKILTNPTLISIGAGFLILKFRIGIPQIITSAVQSMGDTLPPLSMIMLGVVCADYQFKQGTSLKGVMLPVAIRLVLFPLISLGVVAIIQNFIPLGSAWQVCYTVMLGAAGPSAALIPQIAEVYGVNTERASFINILSTLLCVITLPTVTLILLQILQE